MNISLNIGVSTITFSTGIDKNHMEETRVSDFLFRLWFLFYGKKRVTFCSFFKHYFLDYIEQKLGPKKEK